MKASTPATMLIEAAQRGEAGAIEALLAASKPDLQRFARRLCAGPEDAEDAVQNALWILHRKVGMLRAVPAFAGWLFRVVARECRRLMRKAGIALDPSELDAIAAPRIPSELQRDLASAIEALPDDYRRVLILRDIEEMTAPEAAEALNLLADPSLAAHLARGTAGLLAIVCSFAAPWNAAWPALILLPLALVMLRGCPMCWLHGTVCALQAKRSPSTTQKGN